MSKFLGTVLTVAFLSSFAFAQTNYDHVDWQKYSENIKDALRSENTGLRLSAMQNLIKYNDYLKISGRGTAIDVMREFKNNKETPARRLALITLYKMNNDWAMSSLRRQYKYEENSSIKNAIAAVVLAYENGNSNN